MPEDGRAMGFDGKTLIHPGADRGGQRGLRHRGRASAPRQRRSSEAYAVCRESMIGASSASTGKMVERLHSGDGRTGDGKGPARIDRRDQDEGPHDMKLYRLLTGPDDSRLLPQGQPRPVEGLGAARLARRCAFNAATGLMHCGQAVTKEVEGKAYES
jgi:hypothetical protein